MFLVQIEPSADMYLTGIVRGGPVCLDSNLTALSGTLRK